MVVDEIALDTLQHHAELHRYRWFPASSAKWKYRTIYYVGDHQVGLWGAKSSVIVGG